MIEDEVGFGTYTGKITLAPDTQKVLEFAVGEAKRTGQNNIGTEHLLLGLIRDEECKAMQIMAKLGVTPEQIRRQTKRVIRETSRAPEEGKQEIKRVIRETSRAPEEGKQEIKAFAAVQQPVKKRRMLARHP